MSQQGEYRLSTGNYICNNLSLLHRIANTNWLENDMVLHFIQSHLYCEMKKDVGHVLISLFKIQ